MIGNRTYIIAEVAQAHEGSLGTAYSYINNLARLGVSAVKFQAHYADQESTLDEQFRIRGSGQDATRYDYWRRMEFSEGQWNDIKLYCDELGVDFICSPFSRYSIDVLSNIGMKYWKIGSGEACSRELLTYILNKDPKHLIVSTGMLTWEEIDDLNSFLLNARVPYSLLHCVSKYPTPLEEIGLNLVSEIRDRFNCSTGFSDHSGNLNVGYMALSHNVDVYEAHVCFDRRQYGPDVSSSLTIDEFGKLVAFRDDLHKICSSRIIKNTHNDEVIATRNLFTKSLALDSSYPAGTVLTHDMIVLKKPGTGIPHSMIDKVVGKLLLQDWPDNRLLKWEILG